LAVALAALASMSTATTVAPSAAKSKALARPIPDPAAVTTAILSCSFTMTSPAYQGSYDDSD
jgi:hypothetical protein